MQAQATGSSDPFARLLGGGSTETEEGRLSGARGCAAREAFMDIMRKHPDRLLDSFRRKLA
eukprot:2692514-Heterocapsa_arctica.AAC.1